MCARPSGLSVVGVWFFRPKFVQNNLIHKETLTVKVCDRVYG